MVLKPTGSRDTRASYAAAREELLNRILQALMADARFVTAWLLGSYARGEQDEVSDIDLAVVVEANAARSLCTRTTMTSATATPERMALFEAFGEIANLHENHNNAPEDGTFSSVMYRHPPVIVDWTLLPQAIAVRPTESRLLFDKVGIAVLERQQQTLTPAQRKQATDERLAFFWMMAAVTAKYIARERQARVQGFLSFLESIVAEIEGLSGQAKTPPAEKLFVNREAQAARLMELCVRVQSLMETAQAPAMKAVETILQLK